MSTKQRRLLRFLPVFLSIIFLQNLALSLVGSQGGTFDLAMRTSGEAYLEVKAADAAGANVTTLVFRFNGGLIPLDQARDLEAAGDETNAASAASEATSVFSSLIPDAQGLRDAATSKRQLEMRIRLLGVPVESAAVALAVVLLFSVVKWVQAKQLLELKLKIKSQRGCGD